MRPYDRRDFLALGIGALAVATLPALRGRTRMVRRRIPVMGTVAEVAVPTHDEPWAQRAIDAAFGELRRIELEMSRFRPDSYVSRLNTARPGDWVDVSADAASVLERSLSWARASDGRFDPCLGRVSELWDVAHRSEPPAEEVVSGLAGADRWRALELVPDRVGGGGRAALISPRAAVDLGGIAKGFAVDAAADALRAHGIQDGLVNVGGDLVALGSDASGRAWVVGVQSPDDPSGIAATVEVSDAALATSGDYVRYFQHGGRRYHHLLDPHTGRPVRTGTRSLTVRAARCVDADAAATALFGVDPGVRRERVADAPEEIRIIHQITEVTT